MRALNLSGERYGRLLVQAASGKTPTGQLVWRCLCDCGNTANVSGSQLRRKGPKRTRSCGCAHAKEGPFKFKGREREYHREKSKTPKARARGAAYKRIRRVTDPGWRARQREHGRARYRKAPEKRRSAQYETNYLKRYGITPAERADMVSRQCGLCACCAALLVPTRNGVVGVVDHDHQTGVVRAIVCARCNLAIGWAEAEGAIEKARAYLRRYGRPRRLLGDCHREPALGEGDRSEPLP